MFHSHQISLHHKFPEKLSAFILSYISDFCYSVYLVMLFGSSSSSSAVYILPQKHLQDFRYLAHYLAHFFAYFLLQDRFRLLQCCQNPHCIVVIFLPDQDFIQCFICSEVPTHAAGSSPARGYHFFFVINSLCFVFDFL